MNLIRLILLKVAVNFQNLFGELVVQIVTHLNFNAVL